MDITKLYQAWINGIPGASEAHFHVTDSRTAFTAGVASALLYRDQSTAIDALRKLVWRRDDGRWFGCSYEDVDVTDIVGPLLENASKRSLGEDS